MENNTYAPVIITTLNRFIHFKRCLESLESCTGAEYTDVYVGLDYPPSEKYVEGWKKTDIYLKEKELYNGFKNLYVRRRDHNFGHGGNSRLLYNEVQQISDRIISTEDDNEFSPCFLEYMNKALEKYKYEERVICVCGYTPFDYQGNENVYFCRQNFAWGVGRWFEKLKATRNFRDLEYQEKVLKDFQSAMRLYKFRPIILSRVMDQVIHKKIYGDVSFTCFCVQNNMYSIYPSKTLVKNWGNDGSGLHCKVDSFYIKREISHDKTFEMDDVEVAERLDVTKQAQKVSSKKWYGNFVILLRYLIWRISKVDIFSLRRLF